MILTVFSSNVVAIMMAPYWLEPRSRWCVLVFALASAGTSVYSGPVRGVPHHGHRGDMSCSGAPTFRSTLSTRGPDPGDLTGTPE